MQTLDLTGQQYGWLKVLHRVDNIGIRVAWACRCRCGTVVTVRSQDLRSGNTQSCECMHTIHGRASHKTGIDPLFVVWINMMQRCNNPVHEKYDNYGGRGIRVCRRWSGKRTGLLNFIADMGPRPRGRSIDRIDNDKGYNPGNCRWATAKQQAENRRPRRRN